jgi:hypothetical protein
MTMQDWETCLYRFIEATDRKVLQGAGKVTAEIAKAHGAGVGQAAALLLCGEVQDRFRVSCGMTNAPDVVWIRPSTCAG